MLLTRRSRASSKWEEVATGAESSWVKYQVVERVAVGDPLEAELVGFWLSLQVLFVAPSFFIVLGKKRETCGPK